jgi:hypothetical protein
MKFVHYIAEGIFFPVERLKGGAAPEHQVCDETKSTEYYYDTCNEISVHRSGRSVNYRIISIEFNKIVSVIARDRASEPPAVCKEASGARSNHPGLFVEEFLEYYLSAAEPREGGLNQVQSDETGE